MSEIERRFTVEEKYGWFIHSVDDLLYGVIQQLCTNNVNEPNDSYKKCYITKQNYVKNRKFIMATCGIDNTKTLKRHLDKLIEQNLIKEFTMTVNNIDYPCYGITIDRDRKYELIELEWLKYLTSSLNKNALRVYVFLLNKFLWKKRENDTYIFTIKEIVSAFGYSESTKSVHEVYKNILEFLYNSNIVHFVKFSESYVTPAGDIVPTPKYRLTFVATTKQDLPPSPIVDNFGNAMN